MCTAMKQKKKIAQEQPQECDKDLKASNWPQNATEPNLTELRRTCLKNYAHYARYHIGIYFI